MHAEEKNLIDGLFSRLRAAESQSAPREVEAEALINEYVTRQPAAPYYMAQAIIVQENAIQQLDARVKELEAQIETLKRTQSAPQQSSGGFLSGLFGGNRSQQAPAQQQSVGTPARSGWHEPAAGQGNGSGQPARFAQPSGFGQRPGFGQPQGGGFLSGALQTAAGVAGGMVLGNLLMDMFQGDESEQLAQQAPAEAAEQPVAQEEPVVAEENYADNGDFDDEGGDFFGDDDSFV